MGGPLADRYKWSDVFVFPPYDWSKINGFDWGEETPVSMEL